MLIQLVIRSFKRAKQYYLTTVFTLAITLSMVLTAFSLVDLVFFEPMPVDKPDNLYVLQGSLKSSESNEEGATNIHITNYIKQHNDVFSDFALYHEWTDYKLYDLIERPKVMVLLGTENIFDVLGVKATLGRLFNEQEKIGNKQPSVVLGYQTWQQTYQADPDIIGKKIQLNQRRFTVIGVAPQDLALPYYQSVNKAVWVPLDMDEVFDANSCMTCFSGNLKAIVRPKENTSLDIINSQLAELTQQAADLYTAEILKDYTPSSGITLFRTAIQGDSTEIVLLLSIGVSLLLAIALINLSSMQLARAIAKIKTVAISFAYGASNKQLMIEAFKHNFIVIGVAVVFALILTVFGFSIVQTLAVDSIARIESLTLSFNTLAFAFLLTIAIAMLYSYLELKVVNEENLMKSLQSSGKGVGKQMSTGTSHLLIGLQVTFSFIVLVTTCHIVLLTLSEALRDNGLNTSGKWSMMVDYSRITDKEQRANHHQSLLHQLAQINSVTNVKAVSESKFPISRNSGRVFNQQGLFIGNALTPKVSPGYFESLGLELIGRDFELGDSELDNYPVIINQRLAHKISNNLANVIGKKISFDNKKFYTVKAVVANSYFPGYELLESNEVFIPRKYNGEREYYYLLSSNNHELSKQHVRALLTKIDSRLELAHLTTLKQQFNEIRKKHISSAWIAIVLACVSLIMVCVGINGIVNYMVQVRRYDLAVKLAMGADNQRLLKEGIIEMMQPVLISLLFSFSFCFMLLGYSRTLPDLSITPDWLLVTALLIGFAALSLLVSFIPIQQTLAQDPIKALRNE